MNRDLLDLYSDYLISSTGATTATGLSSMLGGMVSHDQITNFLSVRAQTAKDLWLVVKPIVRGLEQADGILIIDDSIEEKPYTDENAIVCWHYDYSKDRQVKGINFVSLLYQVGDVSLPIGFEIVAKTEYYTDKQTSKQKRRSPITKNEYYRQLVGQAAQNQVKFQYVVNDSWFSAAENMMFVHRQLKKDFVMPVKCNRKVALSSADKQNGKYVTVETLLWQEEQTREVQLEGVDFPLLLVRQVFTNEDGSYGVLYLVSSDTTLTYERITTIYRKRWKVEEYHRSLKQCASLAKSPTRRVTTQVNHFFAALCGYIKLEMLKVSTHLNHYALKSRIYLQAIRSAFMELQSLNPIRFSST
jgi:DDE superfamily endonuclease